MWKGGRNEERNALTASVFVFLKRERMNRAVGRPFEKCKRAENTIASPETRGGKMETEMRKEELVFFIDSPDGQKVRLPGAREEITTVGDDLLFCHRCPQRVQHDVGDRGSRLRNDV